MVFADLVRAALDAADVPPDSAAGRIALDRAADVGIAVQSASMYAIHYGAPRFPSPPCAQIAAVNLVILATSEAARGVRVVPWRAR